MPATPNTFRSTSYAVAAVVYAYRRLTNSYSRLATVGKKHRQHIVSWA